MTISLTNKVVLVTGGAGLLGQQFCAAIARCGGTAIVADRDFDRADLVAAQLASDYSGRVSAAALDITNKDSIISCMQTVRERHGKIDAVVNNAYPRNAAYGRKLEDVNYADFCDNVSMHLGGYFLVAQQFAALFREQGHGNIINMSSVYGVIAPRFEIYEGTPMTMPVEYAVIKSGVVHLTRYMAKYLKGTGIRVNAISPGGIADQQPQAFLDKYNASCMSKGMLNKDDITGTLVFLLSDASAYINGQNLTVDDGFSL
ncbi:oxidoreductase [Janthinobacterium sp. PC23-8]|uniref:oxidoreductase n=1 Tax=Janthinobacterium sp. PC23-8 TaxID=2012679 RepID=UPI000B964930|nr:oxidoreductase [Janthinobacterium sp. PC23-8]OYO31197.1 flagellin modification protein A [Janthinobacterium sp. PC23-8]